MATPREEAQQRVTFLELFFDPGSAFPIPQAPAMMSKDSTWAGAGPGIPVLSALWWAWAGYAWLTNRVNPEEGGVRLAVFAAMAALLVASLAVPRAFGVDAEVFGIAYFLVRALHIALFGISARDDPRIARLVS